VVFFLLSQDQELDKNGRDYCNRISWMGFCLDQLTTGFWCHLALEGMDDIMNKSREWNQ
jgi:hypothetical protein